MRNYQTKSNQGALPDSITSTRFGAGEFNSVAVELEGAVTTSGQTLAPADGTGEVTDQLAMALAIYGAGGATYHIDTGAVNAYVLTPVSPKESPNAYFNGFSVVFEPGTVNTTASTVNVGGLGVKSITLQNGTALTGGELSGTCCLKYNSGDDRFELIYSSDSALKISQYYEIDSSQADQGATSTNPNTMTIYDVATLVGTSKFATIHLSHNPAAGNQTLYTFDTSLDLSSFPFLLFLIDSGAQFTRTTGNEILTFYSPSNLNVLSHQKLTSVDMLAFLFGGTVYPEWWGAMGDASTDCTDAIQYAVDSLPAPYGGRVFFGPNFYDVTGPITISKGHITIEGTTLEWFASGGSRIRSSGTDDSVLIIAGAGVGTELQMITVKNIGLGKDTTTDSTAGAGIELRHLVRPRILGCTIENCLYGITLYNVSNSIIERNVITRPTSMPVGSTSIGINVDGSIANPSCRIKNNTIAFPVPPHTGTAYGIVNNGAEVTDIFIENNDISWTDVGIYINYTGATILHSQDLHISNNIIDSFVSKGINVSGVHTPGATKIHGNWTAPVPTGATTYGIHIVDSQGATITSHQHFGFTNYATDIGISINSCSGGVISNCVMKGSSYGITLDASELITVSANNVMSDSGYSATTHINLGGSCTRCVINGNVLGGYATNGIVADATITKTILTSNAVDPTNITTPLTDAGTGDVVANNITT